MVPKKKLCPYRFLVPFTNKQELVLSFCPASWSQSQVFKVKNEAAAAVGLSPGHRVHRPIWPVRKGSSDGGWSAGSQVGGMFLHCGNGFI